MKEHEHIKHFRTLVDAHLMLSGHEVSEEVMIDLIKMLFMFHHIFYTAIFENMELLVIGIYNSNLKVSQKSVNFNHGIHSILYIKISNTV